MRKGLIKGARGIVSLSKLVLGTAGFGTTISPEDAFRLMDRYYEAGGRALDTARVYGGSASEKIIGAWLASRGVREEMTLVTKGGHPPLEDMQCSRLSADCLRSDCEESLRDLGTDCADIYFLHRDDPARPVSEIMDALHQLVMEGKVRALGASNWSVARIREANRYAVRAGKTPFSVSQIQWSLAVCTAGRLGDDTLVCMDEEEYRGYREEGIPVMAFSSQAGGYFSKYAAGGRKAVETGLASRFVSEENLARAERVRRVSAETGLTPAAVALAYLTCNPLDAYAVIGCSHMAQLEDSLSAADAVLDPAVLLG